MDGYRYPITELRGDYFRAGAGMVFFGVLLIGASSIPFWFVVIGSIFLLFLGFGVQTWSRHMTLIQIEPDGLRFMAFGAMRFHGMTSRARSYAFHSQTRTEMPGGWNSPCLKEKRRPRLILAWKASTISQPRSPKESKKKASLSMRTVSKISMRSAFRRNRQGCRKPQRNSIR